MSVITLRQYTTFKIATLVVFWAAAAAVVAANHLVAVKCAVIVVAAFVYKHVASRPTVEDAFVTGICWSLLSIIAEAIAVIALRGRGYGLVTTPVLMTWIAAPLLFARRRS